MAFENGYATKEFVKQELQTAVKQLAQFLGTEMKNHVVALNEVRTAVNELQNINKEHAESYQKLTNVVDNLYLHQRYILIHLGILVSEGGQDVWSPEFQKWCADETEMYKQMDLAAQEAAKTGSN